MDIEQTINIKGFKVRDFRNKGFLVVDDAYLNGYARYLDPTATAVYLSLCRHADKEQSCFPAQDLIAKEHGLSVWTVRRRLAVLTNWNMIRVQKTRGKNGKWLNNVYFLLDKSEWKKPEENHRADQPHGNSARTTEQLSTTKETHQKVTHIKREINKEKDIIPYKSRYPTLESLGETEFQQIAEYYQVPVEFVRSKYDDLVNYVPNKAGKPYRDYYAALRNFVKLDALKIRKEASEHVSKRGIDARNIK